MNGKKYFYDQVDYFKKILYYIKTIFGVFTIPFLVYLI